MPKQVITFHYQLKGSRGEIIETSKGESPVSFLEGSQQIIPGLEEAILPLKKGDAAEVTVPYQDAYGAYDQSLVAEVPLDQFPSKAINPGDVFEIQKEGMTRLVTVVSITDNIVTIDANHPLAGKNLSFWVEIVERRDATKGELDHGHSHGEGGHSH